MTTISWKQIDTNNSGHVDGNEAAEAKKKDANIKIWDNMTKDEFIVENWAPKITITIGVTENDLKRAEDEYKKAKKAFEEKYGLSNKLSYEMNGFFHGSLLGKVVQGFVAMFTLGRCGTNPEGYSTRYQFDKSELKEKEEKFREMQHLYYTEGSWEL